MEGPDNGGRHHHLVRLAYLCFQSYVLLDPTELVLSFKSFLFISMGYNPNNQTTVPV